MESLENHSDVKSFWEHLEVLRWTIIRIIIAITVIVILVFAFYTPYISNFLFAPLNSDFIFYRGLCRLSELVNMPKLCPEEFHLELININLSGQFMTQITTTLYIAAFVAAPYIIYEIWKFVEPALYTNERKSVGKAFFSATFLFYTGVLTAYLVIFPLSVRFLGTYELSPNVPNRISLQSYFDTFFILLISLGLAFEMPVLTYLLSRLGVVNKLLLKKIRKYVVVGVLIAAALITPTTDPFTMLIVALPLYLLYELSIKVSRETTVESATENEEEDEEEDDKAPY